MAIFDPVEAKRISEWLDEGEAVQAATALLASKSRKHKAIRPLVVQCVRQLIELAQRAQSNGDLETAAKHSRPASELLHLSGSDAELARQIEMALQHSANQRAIDLEDLSRGRQLHADRRLQTAIEQLQPVAHLPDAKRMLERVNADMQAYVRYCDSCEKAVKDKSLQRAKRRLEKAKMVNRSGERVMDLEEDIDDLAKELGAQRDESDNCHVITSNDKGFILDLGDPQVNTLVLFGHCHVIGSPRNDHTPADIRIDGASFLHQQHAVIFRHQKKGRMVYWITPHPSYSENNVKVKKSDGTIFDVQDCNAHGKADLEDGDVILLGTEGSDEVAALRFSQKQNRLTAMLDVAPTSENAGQSFAGGTYSCKIALIFDELVINGNSTDADVKCPSLTIGSIALQCRNDRPTIQAEELRIITHSDSGDEYDDDFLHVNSTVSVRENSQVALASLLYDPQPPLIRFHIRPIH